VQTCDDGSIDYGPAEPGDDLVEVFDGIVVKVAGGSTWEPFVKSEEEAEK